MPPTPFVSPFFVSMINGDILYCAIFSIFLSFLVGFSSLISNTLNQCCSLNVIRVPLVPVVYNSGTSQKWQKRQDELISLLAYWTLNCYISIGLAFISSVSLSVAWKELSNARVFISDYLSIFVLNIDKLSYPSVIAVRRGNVLFSPWSQIRKV